MRAKLDQHPFLSLREPWANNDNTIWLASTLSLFRNLHNRPFPSKLDEKQRLQLRTQLTKALTANSAFEKGHAVEAEAMGPLEKEFIYEHFLSFRNFQQALKGDGFVVGESGALLAVLNVRDHLHLQLTDTSETLEEAWQRLVQIETSIGKTLPYSYSGRFGYLTAEPTQCGTALVARLFLHVPALIHTGVLPETLERFASEDVEIAGITGTLDDIAGDLLAVTNRCTLGLSEEDILQSVRAAALKLTVAEKRARKELAATRDPHAMDEVSRAFGLALHSYQLETVEAWDAISLLKLGTDLGWVTGLSQELLNELFFDCRRAHLVAQHTEEITQDELAHRRAEFIHASLTNARLEI